MLFLDLVVPLWLINLHVVAAFMSGIDRRLRPAPAALPGLYWRVCVDSKAQGQACALIASL